MVTDIRSSLCVLSLTGTLAVLLNTGCVAPTVVGGDDALTDASGSVNSIAFHQTTDPTTLNVVLSTYALSCASPSLMGAQDDKCQLGWNVSFALPSASQVPGTYSLSDAAFQAVVTETVDDGQGSCGGGLFGAGSFDAIGASDVTVEVVSIDASTITVHLSGFNANGDLPLADGDYDVPLCN